MTLICVFEHAKGSCDLTAGLACSLVACRNSCMEQGQGFSLLQGLVLIEGKNRDRGLGKQGETRNKPYRILPSLAVEAGDREPRDEHSAHADA